MSLKIELTTTLGEEKGTPKPNKHTHTHRPSPSKNPTNPQTKDPQQTPPSIGIQYLIEIIEILLTLLLCSLEKLRKNVIDCEK